MEEKKRKRIENERLKREQDAKKVKLTTLAQISEQIKSGVVRELPILVKADVDGSAEALLHRVTQRFTKLHGEKTANNEQFFLVFRAILIRFPADKNENMFKLNFKKLITVDKI